MRSTETIKELTDLSKRLEMIISDHILDIKYEKHRNSGKAWRLAKKTSVGS